MFHWGGFAVQSAKHVVEGAEEFLEKARKRSGEFIHDEAQMIRHKLSDAAASFRDKTSGFTDSTDPTTRTIREIKKKSREHGGHSDEMGRHFDSLISKTNSLCASQHLKCFSMYSLFVSLIILVNTENKLNAVVNHATSTAG